MESLTSTAILDFHPDTLQQVRQQYDLDRPDRMKEAIDIMEEWVKKQNHFEVKIFPRDYLERLIVNNKGSVEKTKKKLDTLCTMRTLSPDYFEVYDANDNSFDHLKLVILPKLTKEHYRVGIFKASGNQFTEKIFYNYFRYAIMLIEYQQMWDYCDGITYVVDYNDASLMDYVLNKNIFEFKKFMEIFMKGFSMRIIGLHLLATSKSMEVILKLLKQSVSVKLYNRIHVHKHIDTLYEYIPREILPPEYGGTEKSIDEVQDNVAKELSSIDFTTHRKEMIKCRTNEAHRQTDKFNEEYFGISGTFRNLSVD